MSLFHGGTLGPEREIGKNKAIATGLGLIDKGSRFHLSEPVARRGRVHIAR